MSKTYFARRAAGALVAAGLLLGGSALAAAPAQAAISNCPSGAACIWGDSNYVTKGVGTSLVAFQKYIPDYSKWQYSGTTLGANDAASSLYNNGNMSKVSFYEDANRGGWSIGFDKKTGASNLANNGANDELSSGYFAGF